MKQAKTLLGLLMAVGILMLTTDVSGEAKREDDDNPVFAPVCSTCECDLDRARDTICSLQEEVAELRLRECQRHCKEGASSIGLESCMMTCNWLYGSDSVTCRYERWR